MRLFILAAVLAITGCAPESGQAVPSATPHTQQIQGVKMNITVNGQTFAATLADTQAATEFGKLLPLTLELQDYNRNEKFGALPQALSANDKAVGRIEAGDILLWQGRDLVVFYESFNTSYRYTRIGKIDNVENLKSALGTGGVSVQFAR